MLQQRAVCIGPIVSHAKLEKNVFIMKETVEK